MQKRDADRFVMAAGLQIPLLFRRGNFREVELFDDTAVLEFKLSKPINVYQLMDELDDHINIILLYHVIPSDATQLGQRVCAYSNPEFGDMFKVNAVSDDNGEIDTVHVTLYDDLTDMGFEIRDELLEMTGKYKREFARDEADVLRDFMK